MCSTDSEWDKKISAAFTDCGAYWRACGSLLYIGHNMCSFLASK